MPCAFGLVYVYPFLEWESTPNLAVAPFRCPQIVLEIIRSIFLPFGELETISQPPFVFCSAPYCIRFLCFPPHMRLPQVSVGRTSGSWSSSTFFHRRPRATAFELSNMFRGINEAARASDALCCRPRERGALGGLVPELLFH